MIKITSFFYFFFFCRFKMYDFRESDNDNDVHHKRTPKHVRYFGVHRLIIGKYR